MKRSIFSTLGNPNRIERDIEIHSEEEINPLIQQEQQIDTRDSSGMFSINCILLNFKHKSEMAFTFSKMYGILQQF